MYMLLAMSAMMGGVSSTPFTEPRRRNYDPRPSKLSPEEEAKVLAERKEKFLLNLEKHNADRQLNFPRWKSYEVYGLQIFASKEKNAIRDMNALMKQNHIQIKEEV
jgi:hypothetical protein